MASSSKDIKDLIVSNKYKLKRQIGSGSFGVIYTAVNIYNKNEEVAVKLEHIKAKHPQLEYENKVYKIIGEGIGVPHIHHFGMECEHRYIVMDLLGPSLEDLFNFCNRRFTMKTTIMLADQMLNRIQYLHAKHFIHRDIKPDNFLMGVNRNCNKVYLVDYGLAKCYIDSRHRTHIPYKEHKSLTGTARYASTNAHKGKEQSRRDDLLSLGYVLIYFFRGSLPWQGLKGDTKKERYEKILTKKDKTPFLTLCHDCPQEFFTYFDYCARLRFDEEPDYKFLRKLMRGVLVSNKLDIDYQYDWTIIKQNKLPIVNKNK